MSAGRSVISSPEQPPIYATTVVVEVRCRVQQTFDHIARGFFANHPRWDPAVKQMILDGDAPVGLGTTGTEIRSYGMGRMVSPIRVTAFEPDRRFSFRTTSGPLLEVIDWTIEATPAGGSRITTALKFTPIALYLRVMGPLLRLGLRRNVAANIERFRATLESEC